MSFLACFSLLFAFFTHEGKAPIDAITTLMVAPELTDIQEQTREGGEELKSIDQTEDLAPIAEPQSPINQALDNGADEAPLPQVFEGESDEQVIERITTYLERVDTLSGKFYQQAPSGTLSTGAFFIRRPGLLRFDYDPPTPLLIVANGGTVFVTDEALKTTDSYPVGKTPLKYLLRKKIDLDKAEIVAVEREPDAVAVTLKPRDGETEGELTLVFAAPTLSLLRWVVRDVRNGLTIVDLVDVVEDKKLENELFRIPETKSPFLKD